MHKRLYLWIKDDIEKDRTFTLLIEIATYLTFVPTMYFMFETGTGICAFLFQIDPYVSSTIIFIFSLLTFTLFIHSSCALAEIIHRIRT